MTPLDLSYHKSTQLRKLSGLGGGSRRLRALTRLISGTNLTQFLTDEEPSWGRCHPICRVLTFWKSFILQKKTGNQSI